MKDVKHLFFDLDHTLWDYDRSSQETLLAIYDEHQLVHSDVSAKEFLDTFYKINNHLWHLYNHGEIDREYIKKNRFAEIFNQLGVDPDRSAQASHYFLHHCSTKPYLIDHAKAALDYLKERYRLHIITNGFTDSQRNKLTYSGIEGYFEIVVTSESIGAKKPSPEIFIHSLAEAGAQVTESVMIGDNPTTDISGAKEVGMTSVLFDPTGQKKSVADFEIQSLLELIKLF